MVTDLAEVFRLGTAKAKENIAFRRYLAARHRTDEKPFQILASEIQEQIDCTTCANCCRASEVAVVEEDIARIAAHLEITVQDAERLYTAPDPADSERRILKSEEDHCVFLDGNLCMIYEARPKPCRDFPHVAAGRHSLGSRAASHARWAALCPIIYNALEAYKHQTGYKP